MNRKARALTSLAVGASLLWTALPFATVHAAVTPPAFEQATSASDVLSAAALGNVSYSTEMVPDGAQLVDGKYEDTEKQITVTLLAEPRAYGTLEGQDSAAVIVAENGGGSGVFVYLETVADQDGKAVNTGTVLLGDRVKPQALTIKNNQVVVDLIQQSPTDPMCCPTEHVLVTYAFDAGGKLMFVSQEPAPTFTTEQLKNLQYVGLQLPPDGTAQLTDGTYENQAERVLVGMGDEPTIAYGQIDGKPAAAVLIGESSVGSAQFTDLAVVLLENGQPVNVATTLLGDRVGVKNLAITEDGMIVVDMVTQGPNDPMCCPTMPTTIVYGLFGNELGYQLIPVAQVAATIDASPVTDQVLATIIQATPYDTTMPPGPQGQPKHAVWSLDKSDPITVMTDYGAYVAIYSVPAYKAMWDAQGDNFVSDTIAQLDQLLKKQPANPPAPLPILPEQPATNDFAAQVKYLDMADGGTGMRWIGRLSQDASPLVSSQLRYFFQGLTSDGERLVVAMVPITTTAIPANYEDLSKDVTDQAENDFTAYSKAMTEELNAIAESDFSPVLSALDQTLQSVTITQTVNTLLPPVLSNLEYQSELAGEKVQLTEGKYEDTANHISVTFMPTPIAYGTLDGEPSAAVLIVETGGGSGTFTNLAVVQNQDGTPVSVASTLLGDRVVVNSLVISNNQITVDMITQGPSDPMCCPTQEVIQVYELKDGKLEMVSETAVEPPAPAATETMTATEPLTGTESITGSESLTATEAMTETEPMTGTESTAGVTDHLAGTAWVWTNTLMSDGTKTTPERTDAFVLTFNDDGSVGATTDCNTFSGTYVEEPDGRLTIALPISTRKACPEGAQEADYIKDLTSITAYITQDGNLHLMLPFDSGTMSYSPAK